MGKLRQEGWIWVAQYHLVAKGESTLHLRAIAERVGIEASLHLERNLVRILSFPEFLEDLGRLMWG